MGESLIQGELPLPQPHDDRPKSIGKIPVIYKKSKSILNNANGFLSEFDYTLNPYSGCTFACTYCYAAFFHGDQIKQETWGKWLEVKENALAVLRAEKRNSLRDKRIYMSSATDPYQPIERHLKMTRAILEELLNHHRPRLVVQTRSPLVIRDIDLLQRFEAVQVNMSITTDDEEIRKIFEPRCASLEQRLGAITKLNQAGIPTSITMAPLLPVKDPRVFAQRLLATGVRKFIIQFFHIHSGQGLFSARTRDEAVRLYKDLNWSEASYKRTLAILRSYLPNLSEGKPGFAPI